MEIGTIDTFGPLFRISFDLKINSHVKDGWSNAFFLTKFNIGIFVNQNGSLSYNLNFKFELKKWYTIILQLKYIYRQVICP